jgi:TPR repeat protein
VRLGMMYASGDGVPTDESEAVRWFRKAAEKGNAEGEYSLGEMYLTGRGVAVDFHEAVNWIRRAAEKGEVRGQYNLAVFYAQGQGVTKDDSLAAKWMRKAADQGLGAGEFGLGVMYADGKGVPQSAVEAIAWYRRAASQGDGAALNNLAFLLATATDPKVRSPKEAVSVAQRLVGSEPDNPTYLDTLATAYYESGQPDKAAETEHQVVSLKPEDKSYKEALKKYLAAAAKH